MTYCGLFDRIQKQKGLIWFLTLCLFMQFADVYRLAEGYSITITPKPRLLNLLRKPACHPARPLFVEVRTRSWFQYFLTPTCAEAAVLPGAVELLSVSDTPDPFSPNADGRLDKTRIAARFRLNAQNLLAYQNQTGAARFFLESRWQVASPVQALGPARPIVTASSSYESMETNVVDGNPLTGDVVGQMWRGKDGDTERYVQISLPEASASAGLRVYNSFLSNASETIAVFVSEDGSSFEFIDTVGLPHTDRQPVDVRFSLRPVRAIRIDVDTFYGLGPGLGEVQFLFPVEDTGAMSSDSLALVALHRRDAIDPSALSSGSTAELSAYFDWNGERSDGRPFGETTVLYRVKGEVVTDVDDTAPVVTFTTVRDQECVNARAVRIGGRVDEPASVTVNGASVAVNPADRSFVSDSYALSEGANVFTVSATDVFGHTAIYPLTVYADFTSPVAEWVTPADIVTVNSRTLDVEAVVSDDRCGVDTLGILVLVNDDARTVENLSAVPDGQGPNHLRVRGQISLYPGLLVGENRLELRITDLAGNASTAKRTVTVTSSAPAPASGGTIVGVVRDMGTDLALSGASVTVDGIEGGVVSGADGSFMISIPSPGGHAIRIEKSGYSRARQTVSVTSGRFVRLPAVNLVPFVTIADTVIGKLGGIATTADGNVRVTIPAGSFHGQIPLRVGVYHDLAALPAGRSGLPVPPPLHASIVDASDIRPSGVLLDAPVAVQFKNREGLPPGVSLPVVTWDDERQKWHDQPNATLLADASRLAAPVYRLQPVAVVSLPPSYPGNRQEEIWTTQGGGCANCDGEHGVSFDEGFLTHRVSTPWSRTLGQDKSIDLVYHSNTADPTQEFSAVKTVVNSGPNVVAVQVSVEDRLAEKHFYGKIGQSAYNYLWDASNPSGGKAASGLYRFEVLIQDIFRGKPLNASNGLDANTAHPLSVAMPNDVVFPRRLTGTFVVNDRSQSPFGRGWWLAGLEQLRFDPSGAVYDLGSDGAPRLFLETGADTPAARIAEPDVEIVPFGATSPSRLYGFSHDGRLWVSSSVGPFVQINAGFQDPVTAVLAGRNGDRILIVERAKNRVVVADTEGRVLGYVDSATVDGRRLALRSPGAITAGPDGMVYVADASRRIFMIDADRLDLDLFLANPLPGTGIDPNALAVDPSGDLVISSASDVYRLDRSQNLVKLATLPNWVDALFVDPSGNIFAHTSFLIEQKDLFIINRAGAVQPYLRLNAGIHGFLVTADTVYVRTSDEPKIQEFSRRQRFIEIDPQRSGQSTIRRTPDGGYTLTEKDLTKKVFDAFGNHVQTIDPNGNTTSFVYDDAAAAAPKLIRITNAVGQSTTLDYTNDRLSRITTHTGRVTQISSTADGDVVQIALPDGSAQTFAYEGRGRMVSKKDPKGAETAYVYDISGRVRERVDPLGQRSKFEPQEIQNLINRMSSTVGTKTSPALAPSPVPAKFTDAKNSVRTILYAALGLAVESTEPDGMKTVTVRDAAGRPTVIDKPDENDRAFVYNTFGNVTRIDEGKVVIAGTSRQMVSIQSTQTFEYDTRFSKVSRSVDALGRATVTAYDAAGNPARVTDAEGKTTEMSYASRGLVTLIRDPTGKETQFTYDANGNTDQTTDPLGNVTGLAYDPTGNVNQVSDPTGRKTKFEYDETDKLKKVTDPDNKITTYDYDLNGNLTKITDALGRLTQFFYDKENRLTRRVNALDQEESFSYDAVGNLIEKVKSDATHIQFHYDANNRLVDKITPADAVQFTYDPFGRLIAVRDNDSRLRMEYDQQNRVIRQDQAGYTSYEFTIKYDYDLAGNRISMRHSEMPAGAKVTYDYDSSSRVKKIVDQFGEQIDFSYDSSGNRTRMIRDAGRLVSEWSYDAKNRLTDIEHKFNGTAKSFFQYEYNKNDNRTSMTDRHGTRTYTYDDLDRLTNVFFVPDPLDPQSSALVPALTENFSYDPVGNRTADARTDSYAYDPANRIQTDGIYLYDFDANGNMTEKRLVNNSLASSDTPARTRYVYDAEDRLIRVDLFFSPTTGPVPDKTVRYRYDGLGRRTEKSVINGTTPGDIGMYFYDEEDIVSRRVQAGSPLQWVKRLPVTEIRASVSNAQKTKIYAATDKGLYVLDAATGTEHVLNAPSGHLINDSVRDVYFYDAAADTTFDRTGAGKSWSTWGPFPTQALVVSTDREVTILDAATENVYTRFIRGEQNALTDTQPRQYVQAIVGTGLFNGAIKFYRRVYGLIVEAPDTLGAVRQRPMQVFMGDGKLVVELMAEVNMKQVEANDPLTQILYRTAGDIIVFNFKNDEVAANMVESMTDEIFTMPSGAHGFGPNITRRYHGKISEANQSRGFDLHVRGYFELIDGWNKWTNDMRLLRVGTGKQFLVRTDKGRDGSSNGLEEGDIDLCPVNDIETNSISTFMSMYTLVGRDAEVTTKGELYAAHRKKPPLSGYDGYYVGPDFILLQDVDKLADTVTVDPDIYTVDPRYKNRLLGEPTGWVDIYAESAAAPVAAFLNDTITTPNNHRGILFYQHGMGKDQDGEILPLTIEALEGQSDLVPGTNRLVIGLKGGLTLIDESVGNLDFASIVPPGYRGDSPVVPWDRVNKAVYRNWSPHAISDGQIPNDRVDNAIVIDPDHSIIVENGIDPGDGPTIARLDFSVISGSRRDDIVHGPGIDEPLIVHTDTGGGIQTAFYLSNALGSITELVSKDGQIDGELEYSSFGRIVHSSGIGLDQCYSYASREFEPELGLYFMRTRYYDPQTGRFIQDDKLNYASNLTKYQPFLNAVMLSRIFDNTIPEYLQIYVKNNPINLIDPSGEFFGPVIDMGIAALVYGILVINRLQSIVAGALAIGIYFGIHSFGDFILVGKNPRQTKIYRQKADFKGEMTKTGLKFEDELAQRGIKIQALKDEGWTDSDIEELKKFSP